MTTQTTVARENYLYDLMNLAHVRAARRLGAVIVNHGWVGSETGICSKTSDGGYLTTKRREGGGYTHNFEQSPAQLVKSVEHARAVYAVKKKLISRGLSMKNVIVI